jgi:futalosine hydrolase
MKLLLVAATKAEITPVLEYLGNHFKLLPSGLYTRGQVQIEVCITGVGAVATTWALAKIFPQFQPDWCVQAGIAGSLDPALSPGSVVHVVSDTFADAGAEDRDGSLLSIFDLGFSDPNTFPYRNGLLVNLEAESIKFLPSAHGITVQRAHGYAPSIERIRQAYPDAAVESMEGAAFAYACLMAGLRYVQIRSISNRVEPRDRAAWNIPLAVGNLADTLIGMIEQL